MNRIIKSGNTKWIDGKWVVTAPVSEGDAEQDATPDVPPPPDPAEVLAAAYAEAQAILQKAEQEATALIENVTRAAYEDGLTQGRQEAYEQGMAEWRSLLDSLHSETDQFLAQREAHLNAAEPDMVRLGLLVGSKILLREPKDAPLIKSVIQEAVAKLNGQAVVRVRVSPADLARMAPPNPMRQQQETPKFELVADPAVGQGGCIVETQLGRVDATFATQFDELVRTLLDTEAEADPALKGAADDLKKPAMQAPKTPAKPGRPGGGFGPGGFGGGGFGR